MRLIHLRNFIFHLSKILKYVKRKESGKYREKDRLSKALDPKQRHVSPSKQVMKLVRIKSLRRRLPSFAFPRWLWAKIFASNFGEKRILESKIFWNLYDSYLRRHRNEN